MYIANESKVIKCSKCQSENDDDNTYCTKCGNELYVVVHKNTKSLILTIFGLFPSILFAVSGIFATKGIHDELILYSNSVNFYNNLTKGYPFSGISNSLSQTGVTALQQLYTNLLILTIVLVIVVVLAIISIILIHKKHYLAKATLTGCGVLTFMLVIPLIPGLISSMNVNYSSQLANNINLFTTTSILAFIIGFVINAIIYFSAALLYKN